MKKRVTRKKLGRPRSKNITPRAREMFCTAIEAGRTQECAARLAGSALATIKRCAEHDAEFKAQIETAKGNQSTPQASTAVATGEFDLRRAAKEFLPTIFEGLKQTCMQRKAIMAAVQSMELMVKYAEYEQDLDDRNQEIQVKRAVPTNIVPLHEATGT